MILTNGCSFTEGHNLPDPTDAWPAKLGKFLETPVTNLALGGSSNTRISRTLREALVVSNPDIVVVGWTTHDRDELSHSKGAYIRATAEQCLAECEEQFVDLTTIHKNWLIHNQNTWVNFRNWVYNVLFFQQYLELKRIPFLFFTAFGDNYLNDFLNNLDSSLHLADQSYQWRDRSLFKPERSIHNEWQELRQLCNQIDLSKWVFNNKETMQQYLLRNNFEKDHQGHFMSQGHAAWADVIAGALK